MLPTWTISPCILSGYKGIQRISGCRKNGTRLAFNCSIPNSCLLIEINKMLYTCIIRVCAQHAPTLCNPIDCSPPVSSVHWTLRQEYWSGLPFPPPGELPDPGIEPMSPVLAGRFLITELPGKPYRIIWNKDIFHFKNTFHWHKKH